MASWVLKDQMPREDAERTSFLPQCVCPPIPVRPGVVLPLCMCEHHGVTGITSVLALDVTFCKGKEKPPTWTNAVWSILLGKG